MIYKKYKDADKKDVVKLLNICFGDKSITDKSFTWKHFDNFFEKKEQAVVVKDGDRVVSFVCFTPIEIYDGGNIETVYSCSVQATHPEYRRMGIVTKATKIIESKLNKNTIYMGFSNDSGVKIDKYSKNINYEILGKMKTSYFLPFISKTNLTHNVIDFIPKEANSLNSNLLSIYKDHNYLNWKYIKNPKGKFIYLEIKKSGVTVALVILKKVDLKMEISLVITNKIDLITCIFKEVFNFSIFQGAVLCSFSYLDNCIWRNVLPKFKVSRPIEMYFTLKSSKQKYLKLNNWFIQGGDIQ